MAVSVKPNGLLGAVLAAIRPFRHLIVYPAIIREAEQLWEAMPRETVGRQTTETQLQ
jgi:hypothetical protein